MAQGIQEAWQGHQVQVRKLEGNGKVVHPQTSFNSYVDMSHREEETFPYFSAD